MTAMSLIQLAMPSCKHEYLNRLTFLGSPIIQCSLQSGPGVEHEKTTSRKTVAELNTLREGLTNTASFMSDLLYLQENNIQKT